jgi:hypothetical protein
MNRKETIASLAIVGMALLATIITATTPTQALAIDYGSPDLSYLPKGGFAEDGTNNSDNSDNTKGDSGDGEEADSTTAATTGEDEGSEESNNSSNAKEDSSSLGYDAFQDCLANVGESPTEQEVQDCVDSSYGGQDNGEQDPNESADGNDKGDTGVTQELSGEE